VRSIASSQNLGFEPEHDELLRMLLARDRVDRSRHVEIAHPRQYLDQRAVGLVEHLDTVA
jgi:hypothetical protein